MYIAMNARRRMGGSCMRDMQKSGGRFFVQGQRSNTRSIGKSVSLIRESMEKSIQRKLRNIIENSIGETGRGTQSVFESGSRRTHHTQSSRKSEGDQERRSSLQRSQDRNGKIYSRNSMGNVPTVANLPIPRIMWCPLFRVGATRQIILFQHVGDATHQRGGGILSNG